MSALARRLTEDAPPLSGRRAGVHPELERIVHRSLTRDRESRYASAAEMREDLETFLAEVHPKTTRSRPSSAERPAIASPTAPTVAPVPAPPLARPAPEAPPWPSIERAPTPSTLAPATFAPVTRVPTARAPSFRDSSAQVPSAQAPVAPSPARPAWLWPTAAAGIVVLAAFAAGAYFLTRGRESKVVSEPRPAVTPVAPPPAPTAASVRVEEPTPTTLLTVPTPLPAAVATAVPARVHVAREAPTRAPAPVHTVAPTPVPHRAMTKPDVEEEVKIALSPAQERECGGQVVGVSAVIGKDGSLKSRRVISPVSPACDALALETLSRYRFRPARDERGQPIEGRFGLSIRF